MIDIMQYTCSTLDSLSFYFKFTTATIFWLCSYTNEQFWLVTGSESEVDRDVECQRDLQALFTA